MSNGGTSRVGFVDEMQKHNTIAVTDQSLMNIQEATSPAVKPKQSALEKYNIDDKDTPWANVKE